MSGHIPKTFINELLARTDIVELIDTRLPLKKKGGSSSNFFAPCPFHQEKTASFSVSPTKQFYYCFGCGETGNVLSFLMKHDRMDFLEAVEMLAAQQGLEIPRDAGYKAKNTAETKDLYQWLEKAAHYYGSQLKPHPHAIDYLKNRGLTGETVKHFNIGYAPDGWDSLIKYFNADKKLQETLAQVGLLIQKENGGYYDRFRDRIVFPIKNRQGRVVGFGGRTLGDGTPKYLNSPETPLFHKSNELYGLYEARMAHKELKQLLIVEGYMDLVALAQYDVRYAVATLGTATTKQHLERLFRETDTIVFCFDGDNAGKKAAWRALQVALPCLSDGRQVRFIFLPDGEDPDSFIQAKGKDSFLDMIDNAMPLSDFFFLHLKAEANLESIDGRSRFAHEAGPLVEQIPAGYFRDMMQQALAKIVQIDSGLLPKAQESSVITTQKETQRLTPMRRTIALILQHPTIARDIDITALSDLELPGSKLLNTIIEACQSLPQVNTAILLEHFRDTDEQQHLYKLANRELLIPDDGAENELKGAIKHIKQIDNEDKADKLIAKANREALTNDEKQQLQRLITQAKSESMAL